MDCQNLLTESLANPTYKAAHALSEPTYGKLDKQAYKTTHERSEPTYEHLGKPNTQSYT
jgi:hypothetical protein